MRIIGVMVFLAGMVMFASGLVFLDLASLPLKNDLYSIDVLGFFNNMIDPDLIPNYERVGKGKPFGNFIAFPTQMARATYNKMVKLGIVNGKVWKS